MTTNPWDAVMSAVTKLADRVDTLPTVREATCTSISPYAILFDTDTVPTLANGTLAHVEVGDRVLVLRLSRYLWILGAKGGPNATELQAYRASDSSHDLPPVDSLQNWQIGTDAIVQGYRRVGYLGGAIWQSNASLSSSETNMARLTISDHKYGDIYKMTFAGGVSGPSVCGLRCGNSSTTTANGRWQWANTGTSTGYQPLHMSSFVHPSILPNGNTYPSAGTVYFDFNARSDGATAYICSNTNDRSCYYVERIYAV